MSEAIIAKKAEQVAIVADKMKAAASIVVVDSRGLTVDQDTVLRRNLRESGVEFKVIKNSILSRAAEKAGLEDLKKLFVGPSAVAFSNEDVIAPAKVISEFAKGAEALEIKGGVVDGAITLSQYSLSFPVAAKRILSSTLSRVSLPSGQCFISSSSAPGIITSFPSGVSSFTP